MNPRGSWATAVLILSLLGASSAHAKLCSTDDVPGATLLLPYFEVDLDPPGGSTTLFSVNNSRASATLAHVTLWTDWGIPTLRFTIYLTGYDVQTINLRDIFRGVLPQTAPDNLDPADTISPQGVLSQDLAFASCSGLSGNLPPVAVSELQRAHTGLSSGFGAGDCVGDNWSDGRVRGYATVDVVTGCTSLSPADSAYYQGVLGSANTLWGKVFQVDPDNDAAQGESLVAIEACPPAVPGQPDSCPFEAGDYTFYARYVGATGADRREPLPSAFHTSFLNGGTFDGGTELTIWRDTKFAPTGGNGSRACTGSPKPRPSWWPLKTQDVVAFDEEENPEDLCSRGANLTIPLTPKCFPLATQRLAFSEWPPDGEALLPSLSFGMFYLYLNGKVTPPAISEFDLNAQAWVTATMTASGRFSIGMDAAHLDRLCSPSPANELTLIP
jgi:hypothetical protein